uniref:Sushi domain-containing protein n=1 Tax=Scleropages formosus TaxID=113540 RepID=A0A8C9TLX6_SCLFO
TSGSENVCVCVCNIWAVIFCYVPGSCGAPIPYPNMQLVEGHLTQQDLQEGSRLRYKCTMGYIRSGGTTSISYCKNGAWTHVDMECERKSCGSAGEILHGHYKYEGNLFGDKAFAVCNKGYQVVGFNYRQCLDMGWDGRDPVCEAVKCADPPEVVDGVWTGPIEGPFKYGTVITYQCRKGQLLGKSEMYCTFKGTWSSAPPQCKGTREEHDLMIFQLTASCAVTYQCEHEGTFSCSWYSSHIPSMTEHFWTLFANAHFTDCTQRYIFLNVLVSDQTCMTYQYFWHLNRSLSSCMHCLLVYIEYIYIYSFSRPFSPKQCTSDRKYNECFTSTERET